MEDSSASYIHMVQHLIEKCLIFRMTKEECIEALSKHGSIEPVITSTVWNELEKENKEFFAAYSQSQSKEDRMSEAETSEMIQKMIADSPKDATDNYKINKD
ncbi:Angiotensin-converting enzyme 2 [Bertholletia excelsa]